MKARRIVIVGFMGCGKTTVAEALAHRLGCQAVDLDSLITEHTGRSPAEIIREDGEPAFREIETAALRDVLQAKKARVIALGGGAWATEANRSMVAGHDCLSVWLDAPFELCWERIRSSDTTRPMAPDLESAERLYGSRRPAYELAMLRVDATGESLTEIVAEVQSGL